MNTIQNGREGEQRRIQAEELRLKQEAETKKEIEILSELSEPLVNYLQKNVLKIVCDGLVDTC